MKGSRAVAAAAVVAMATLGAGGASAHQVTSTAAQAALPKTMTGKVVAAPFGTLSRGTVLKLAANDILTVRMFSTAKNGFALANNKGAQYPVFSTNGGRTWRVAGPALHVNAADSPSSVDEIGVARGTSWAYGPEVIDATSDGGAHWYQVFPQGTVVAVAPTTRGIAAFVATVNGKGALSKIDQYVSRDGGRHWALSSAVAG